MTWEGKKGNPEGKRVTENEDSLFRLCSKVPLDSGLQPALLRAPIPPVQVCENYRQRGIQIAWSRSKS